MSHQRRRLSTSQSSHHGGLGVAIAKLAITLLGGMARNKLAEKAQQKASSSKKRR